MGRVLILEDEPRSAKLLGQVLEREGHGVVLAGSVAEARRALDRELFDLVISDVRLPDGSGLELLQSISQDQPGLPVIVVTAYGNVADAVQAMRLGAVDYVQKPFELEAMALLVARTLEQAAIRRERDLLVEQSLRRMATHRLSGRSKAIQEVRFLVEKVAASRATVLLTGESGTGKEVVAQAIHAAFGGVGRPFVRINCPAIPEQLFESELFGHLKGAFTGAVESRKGKFELAGDGTVFLDEIAEIPQALQAKLLQVLEARVFTRVGGTREIPMRARVVAATNRDLKELVGQGRFREDLYYRLNVFPIRVPPLRERLEDIPDLVADLVARLAPEMGVREPKVTDRAMEALQSYDWPGNVRELRNVLERALVLSERGVVDLEHLPEEVLAGGRAEQVGSFRGQVEEFKRNLLLEALRKTQWSKKDAAALLGLSQRAFSHYVKRYNLDRERPEGS